MLRPRHPCKGVVGVGEGGSIKTRGGGGATRVEGTVHKWKGGGWRTVHAVPLPSTQRGGGHVGGVGHVNWGLGVAQPHCPCCAPAIHAKGWRACGGGLACKWGEDVAHPRQRGLPTNKERRGCGALSLLRLSKHAK